MKNPVIFIYSAFRKLLSVTLNVNTKNEFSMATTLQLIVLTKLLLYFFKHIINRQSISC